MPLTPELRDTFEVLGINIYDDYRFPDDFQDWKPKDQRDYALFVIDNL